MKIFVTGGTGFLGRVLLETFRREGHTVLALARSESSAEVARQFGATPVLGSLSTISEWEEKLSGVDAIVHAAAPVTFWGPWQFFNENIVEATRLLVEAAGRSGVGRFIFVSSESVLQAKHALLDIDEAHPYPERPNSFYGLAKQHAEQLLVNMETPMHIVILRPTFVWGPGVPALDTLVAKVRSGEFMWVDQGRTIIEMVHVKNVAAATVLALFRGLDRAIYYVTDKNAMPAREFLSRLLETRAVAPPGKSIPGFFARPAAALVEGMFRLFGVRRAPPLSRFELSFVNMPRRYRIDKIERDLGYRPVVSLEEGLREMREA